MRHQLSKLLWNSTIGDLSYFFGSTKEIGQITNTEMGLWPQVLVTLFLLNIFTYTGTLAQEQD